MPGGWPLNDAEHDQCARVLLECGGDLRRIFDEPALDLDGYVHRLTRVPFFEFLDENPLFLITGRMQKPADVLDLQSRLFEATGIFHHADWVTFQSAEACWDFLDEAAQWAAVEEVYSNVHFWFTWPRPTLIVSSATNESLMPLALAALGSAPVTGIVETPKTPRSGEHSETSGDDDGRPGSVIGLESLARMRAEQKLTTSYEQAGDSQHFKSVRPNPRIRRGKV